MMCRAESDDVRASVTPITANQFFQFLLIVLRIITYRTKVIIPR